MSELEQEMSQAAHEAAGRVFAARVAADHPELPLGLHWSAHETDGDWHARGAYLDAPGDEHVRHVIAAYATALDGTSPQEVSDDDGRALRTTATVGKVAVTVLGVLLSPAGGAPPRTEPACWEWEPLTSADRAAAHTAWRTWHGGRIPDYEEYAGQLLWWWHQGRCAACGRQTAGTAADALVPDVDPATGQWLTGYLCLLCVRDETRAQLMERYHERPPAKILAIRVWRPVAPAGGQGPSAPTTSRTRPSPRPPRDAAMKSITQARQKFTESLRGRFIGPEAPPPDEK